MRGTRIAAAAVAFLAAACALHPVLSPDLWWHLASGRWIVANGSVPATDVLSYTMTEHPWINFQWLTDVGLYAVWSWGGPAALVLAKAAWLALAAVIVFGTCRAVGAGTGPAVAAATLAVLAGAERTFVRPELVTVLGVALVLRAALRVRAGDAVRLAWIPPAVALWINLHSLAFLGPAVLGLHGLLAALDARLPRPLRDLPAAGGGEPEAARDARVAAAPRRLIVTGAVSAVALLVNPFGWRAWAFPVTLFARIRGDVEVFGRIREFERPLDALQDPALRFAILLVALLAVTFVLRGRRPAPARLLGVLPFLALALLARRNIPLLAIAAAPVLALHLRDLLGGAAGAGAGAAAAWRARLAALARFAPAVPAALGIAVLAGASPVLLGLYRDRGVFVEPGLFPEEALAALDATGVSGPVFHDLDFGGYLVWRDPDRPSFIDGRLEVAGADWLSRYVDARENAAAWDRLVGSWNPQALLLGHAGRGDAAFVRALLRDKRWTHWKSTPEAVLLLARERVGLPPPDRPTEADWQRILAAGRGAAPHAGHALDFLADPLQRALAPTPTTATVRRATRYANLMLTLGWIAEARTGYEQIVAAAPDDPEAYFQLGICEVRLGRPEKAREWWERGLERPWLDAESRRLFREALAERASPPGS